MTITPKRRPTSPGLFLGGMGLLLAFVASAPYGWAALGFGVAGVTGFLLGAVLPRPQYFSLGAVGLFAAALLSGLAGAPPETVLIGTVGTILAWDSAHNAASHGRQVGADASTTSAEGLHFLGSAGAGIVSGALAFGIYTGVATGQPRTAIAIMVVGGVLLVLALR